MRVARRAGSQLATSMAAPNSSDAVVNAMRELKRAMFVSTHYCWLLSFIVPYRVHVLVRGRIVKSGGADLALELETSGYEGVVEAA